MIQPHLSVLGKILTGGVLFPENTRIGRYRPLSADALCAVQQLSAAPPPPGETFRSATLYYTFSSCPTVESASRQSSAHICIFWNKVV